MARRSAWEKALETQEQEKRDIEAQELSRRTQLWREYEQFRAGVHSLLPEAVNVLRDALTQTEDARLRVQVALALLRWAQVQPQSGVPKMHSWDVEELYRALRGDSLSGVL